MDFDYIDTKESLQEVVNEIKKTKVIGVDIECENGLHHYGTYISLIQVSSVDKNWIIDVLEIKDIKSFIEILEDGSIQKIFHDVGFDLRILGSEFNCKPKNIFDTEMAARFLGKEKIGLGSLLEEYFSIEKEKKFQRADWCIRPLTKEMLDYAINDSIYLIRLRDILKKELEDLGRLSWLEEGFLEFEKKDWTYNEGTYDSVKGYSLISDTERAVLKRIYDLREELAKKVDKPVHFVIRNKHLIELAQNPPSNWRDVRGVHPIIKKNANKFYQEVSKGLKEKITIPSKERKRFSKEQRECFDLLDELRKEVGQELKIMSALVLNKEQMKQVIVNKNLDSLKSWQKELLKDKIEKLKIIS